MRRAAAAIAALSLALVLGVVRPSVVFGHPDRPHPESSPSPTPPPPKEQPKDQPKERPKDEGGMAHEEAPPETEKPAQAGLTLRVPERSELGTWVGLVATLTSGDGAPIEGALVTFEMVVTWGDWYGGEAVLGSARTDAAGRATLRTQVRTAGTVGFAAHFEGTDAHPAAEAIAQVFVTGDEQLYTPTAGIQVPGVGPWLLISVIGLVWGLYLVVAVRVGAIARAGHAPVPLVPEARPARGLLPRRQFLSRVALPFGLQAVVASVGAGLGALIVRSPRTHANLGGYQPEYGRSPLITLGRHTDTRPMPTFLDREVSFSGDVLPILLARGGPHVMPEGAAGSPGGIRFDTHDAIMGSEDMLVVPGKPEESMLVTVLLDPAMGMPPSLPPLPEEEVRIIVTWVAQGAKDN